MKTFLSFALSCIMILSLCVPAFAAECDATQEIPTSNSITANANTVSPCAVKTFQIRDSYRSVITAADGVNNQVYVNIPNFDYTWFECDIMVFGRNGLIWQEVNWIGKAGNRTSNNFWCGSDATNVTIAIYPRYTFITAKSFEVQVSW